MMPASHLDRANGLAYAPIATPHGRKARATIGRKICRLRFRRQTIGRRKDERGIDALLGATLLRFAAENMDEKTFSLALIIGLFVLLWRLGY